MHRHPGALLPLSLVYFLQLVNADLRVQRAGSDDGSELRSRPLHLPGSSSLDGEHFLLHPFLAALDEGANGLVTAHGCESASRPIEAHIMDDDVGGQVANDVYTSVLAHKSNQIMEIIVIFNSGKMR